MRVLHVGWGFRPWWSGGGLIAYTEAVLAAQAARGHDVSYLLGGRELPGLRGPRLHRWRRDGVRMLEVLGSEAPASAEHGSREPARELDAPATERLVARALAEVAPDVVHVHTFEGLPSALVERVRDAGVPSVMTLQDHHALCPTVKLWDVDGARCERMAPGATCVRCCADGLSGTEQQRYMTRELVVRGAGRRAGRPGARVADALWRRLEGPVGPAVPVAPAAAYDRRRTTNVARLSAIDALVAMSPRMAELHAERGVDPARLRVLRLCLPHIERLAPRERDPGAGPVRFVTLGGAASTPKGADVLLDAVRRLDADPAVPAYRLAVHGRVAPHVAGALAASPAVELRGPYAPEELEARLADAHVGVVPSVWEEAYGYVGAELVAAGLPVISNARGGLPFHTLPGRTGWLNDGADGAGLAAIMGRLAADPGAVAAASRRAIAHRAEVVVPFAEHLDALEAIYAEVVAARAPGAAAGAR